MKELRCLYDEVEKQVRSLNCLGVNSDNYGPMLVPVLFSKIPEELKLIISRKFGKDVWDIQSVLESLKLEVEAREKIYTQDSNSVNQPFSGMSLYTSNYENNKHFLHENRNTSSYENNKQYFNENRIRGRNTQFQPHSYSNSSPVESYVCIFCSRKHQSKHCNIVSNPETRKNILAKEKRCFVCMKFGHIASKCRNDLKCYKCKGRHHVAVCTFKSERRNHYEPENSHTAVAG